MEEAGKGCVVWKRGMEMPEGRLSERKLGWKMKEIPTETPRLGKSWAGMGRPGGASARTRTTVNSGSARETATASESRSPLQTAGSSGSGSPLQTARCRALPPSNPPPSLRSSETLPSPQLRTLLSSAPLYLVSLLVLEPVSEPSSHTGF